VRGIGVVFGQRSQLWWDIGVIEFSFFVENNEGLMRFKRILVELFSGLIIPLSFFPGWAMSALEWMPFQAIMYLPSSFRWELLERPHCAVKSF